MNDQKIKLFPHAKLECKCIAFSFPLFLLLAAPLYGQSSRTTLVADGFQANDVTFDAKRNVVYVANQIMNRIDVFSTASLQRTASIKVSSPMSVDVSYDGKTLYVASSTD